MTQDAIRKTITIDAPVERVWAAIGDAAAFGKWFGVDAEGHQFEPGKLLGMKITDPPEYAGTEFTITVVEVVPPRLLSFRWHAGEPGQDLDDESTTLIEFVLEPEGAGTRLTVTESGFEAIPEHRRASAFRSNDEGWAIQVQRVCDYVEKGQ